MRRSLLLLALLLIQSFARCCSQDEVNCSNQQYATCTTCKWYETCSVKNRECNSCSQLVPNCNTCVCGNQSCISCLPSYYLDKTKTICLPISSCKCQDGYYHDSQCNCLECQITNCQICSRSNYCDTCRPNTYIYSGLFNNLNQIQCVKSSSGIYIKYVANLDLTSKNEECKETIAQLNPGSACLSKAENDYIEKASSQVQNSQALLIFIYIVALSI